MKYYLLSHLFLALTVSGNIIFNHVQLSCSSESQKQYHGCLRGQHCTAKNTCDAGFSETSFKSPRSLKVILHARAVFSTEGTCGSQNGDTVCDPDSQVYNGGCCSQYGFCGSSDAYCGVGCQSGCDNASSSMSPGVVVTSTSATKSSLAGTVSNTTFRPDGRCGREFDNASCDPYGEFGACCSFFAWCGSTPDHCLVANGCQLGCTDVSENSSNTAPSTTTQLPSDRSQEPIIGTPSPTRAGTASATGAITKDGTCGAANNNTICGDWPQGNCCSMYGFCGSTSSHCGPGCQSGHCTSAPSDPAPGPKAAPAAPVPGDFRVVGMSGVPAMHAALMPNGRVVFLDKVENYTQLQLADGYYAYSSEYDPQTNEAVPLSYATNAFCSGGAFLPDGRVISVGGNGPLTWLDPTVGNGFDGIRYLQRSSESTTLDGQSWSEPGNKLASARWYATAQTLPDGTIFVASGSLNGLDPTVPANNNPTYEILSPSGITRGENIPMEILEKNQPYYMYPFIHLLNDGSLFVFVSRSAERFSVTDNLTITSYPDLPGDYRTYPNTGGSVMLPLNSANNWTGDIVFCGGGAYQDITSPTDPSCGRISPLSNTAAWEMDSMPEGRGMVEGTLLPDGTVIWLNGGNRGAQGFGLMSSPTLEALLYMPTNPLGQRFSTLASSTLPRLYHSVALLLLDGTLMIAGSNPVQMPMLVPDADNPYVTEFRVEVFVPPYLMGDNINKRPTDVVLSSKSLTPDGSNFQISFATPPGNSNVKSVLYYGGFVTHSLHMGHRMMELDTTGFVSGAQMQNVSVTMPPNHNICPPGPYVVYVLVDGIPSVGQFVSVN